MSKKLIYASEARKAILNADPKLAYCIDSVPAVDAKKVAHGRWEEYQVPHIMCCSECDWATGVQNDFNYCPNCGADMRG